MLVGATDVVPPLGDTCPLNEASPLAVQEVPLPAVTVQFKDVELPLVMVEGLAVNVTPGGDATVTVAHAFVVPPELLHDNS